MKKGLLATVFFVLLALASMPAHAQHKVGAGVAFGTGIEEVGITANFYTPLQSLQNFRIGGDIIYYFTESNSLIKHTALEFNVNGNYIFYQEQQLTAYALAGLSLGYSKVKWKGETFPGMGQVSGSDTEFGLNLGAGLEYGLGAVDLFGELKFTVGGYDQAVFSAGVRLPIGK